MASPPFGKLEQNYYFDQNGYAGKDFFFDVARGSFRGLMSVNKFGRTTNADSSTATDIWDGANPTEDDPIWLAPTVAQVHEVDSNDANDANGGTGAWKVRVYGLRSWDTAEVFEDITLTGATPVDTVYSYVIIHRIKVLKSGATSSNVGDIFATAKTDGTITAMIIAGQGQTQMAVYGIPSTQNMYVTGFYASIQRVVSSARANIELLWCFDVEAQPTVFQVKHTLGLDQTGAGAIAHLYVPPNRFSGPGILKLQTTTSAADVDVSGGFNLVLEDK